MLSHFPFLSVFLALTALTLAPGLDTVLVLRNGARGGFWDGFVTTWGICTGLFCHAILSALGLSLILLQSAALFSLLKFAGAFFLIYLAIRSFIAAWKGETIKLEDTHNRGLSRSFRTTPLLTSFREGLLSNLLNPKLIVFYMMFLPQFIEPNYSALTQSIMVAGIHFALGIVWLGTLSFMVNRARRYLTRPFSSRCLNGFSGLFLFGFGVKLALFER